jgi:hypothetical protein
MIGSRSFTTGDGEASPWQDFTAPDGWIPGQARTSRERAGLTPAEAESNALTVDASQVPIAIAAGSGVAACPFPGGGPLEPAMSNENVVGVAPTRIAKAGVEAERGSQRRLVEILFADAGCVHRGRRELKQLADQKKLSLLINQFALHRRVSIRSS